jgi:FMN phosphatase YigB (HAD superfamily)
MRRFETWLIDFDETLASGGLTWAFQFAFPKFVSRHQLAYDPQRLDQVMLAVQERASQEADPQPLLQELFENMGWPGHLKDQLLDDLMTSYQPALFDDTMPFLKKLRQHHRRVYVVSNNRQSPQYMPLLGLEPYIDGVFTPHTCPGTQPKPHRSLWDYITAHEHGIDPQTTVVIGDDPWSEGAFAEACGLACWIVDRMNRFSTMRDNGDCQWVRSLAEIPV